MLDEEGERAFKLFRFDELGPSLGSAQSARVFGMMVPAVLTVPLVAWLVVSYRTG